MSKACEAETVGRSSRTPFKHWILKTILGRINGSLSTNSDKVPANPDPFHILDLCAGDGLSTDLHDCSPKIINSHVKWAKDRGMKVRATYIEKGTSTFVQLMANCSGYHNAEFINADATTVSIVPTCPNQAIFVNADPNTIRDWPVSESLIESLTPTTTLLITMGCNVGGLKRLPLDERKEWFDHVAKVTHSLPSFHDAILVVLNNDMAQWAYLIRDPLKWSSKTMEAIRSKAKTLTGSGVTIASIRHNSGEFSELLRQLFLTKKERTNETA